MRSVLVPQKTVSVGARNPLAAGATQSGTLQVDVKTGWRNAAQVVLRNMVNSPEGRLYVRSEMRLSRVSDTS